MSKHQEERPTKRQSRRSRTSRLAILFLVVLIAGAGTGVGMNLMFGKPRVEKATETSQEEEAAEKDGEEEEPSTEETAEKPDTPQFKITQAMSHIFALSEQIGERSAGSVRASGAADYVVSKMGEYGYTVEEQPFTTADGFGSRNIIGTRRGTREGYTIIIGAHYDSPRDSNGAVDDASGVGVVLELARLFSNQRLEPSLKFVFFGANKPGGGDIEDRLVGARRFIDMLGTMDEKDVVGMIEVDCVGQGEQLALRTQETGLQRLKAKLGTYAREAGTETVSLKSTGDSDNIPFEDAGVPAVWIQWCDSDGSLHTDNKYQSVDAGKVETAGTLVESFLYDLTSDDLEELKY